MPLDRFTSMQRNKYWQFGQVADFREIYDWLAEVDQVYRMIEVSNRAKPAIEGVVEELVQKLAGSTTLPLHDEINRKAIGAAVKEILFDYGYIQVQSNVKLSSKVNGDPFKTSTQYEYVAEFETKKLKQVITVINTNKKPPGGISTRTRLKG